MFLTPIVPRYATNAEPRQQSAGCGLLGWWPRPRYVGEGQPSGCSSNRGLLADLFPSTVPRYATAPSLPPKPGLTEDPSTTRTRR